MYINFYSFLKVVVTHAVKNIQIKTLHFVVDADVDEVVPVDFVLVFVTAFENFSTLAISSFKNEIINKIK